MKSINLRLSLPLLLSACSGGYHPVVTSAAPTGIVYRIPSDRVDATRKLAAEHCAGHKKSARFEQVTDTGGESVIAAFRCV